MKRLLNIFVLTIILLLCTGCRSEVNTQIAATTRPVYDFTSYLCKDTGLSVSCIVTQNISCLHDYTLQVDQMQKLENAQLIVLSGAGLEAFMEDMLVNKKTIDASKNIPLLCSTHSHTDDHHEHHENDPHIWLSIDAAQQMSQNIYDGLIEQYPEHKDIFIRNLEQLNNEFNSLKTYGATVLKEISCKNLITFHDGFSYFADANGLHILKAIEEESGSEASAKELSQIIELINENNIPAIFVEKNGSVSAAQIISAETGVKIYYLDMAMGETGYFDAMYNNFNALKEAME